MLKIDIYEKCSNENCKVNRNVIIQQENKLELKIILFDYYNVKIVIRRESEKGEIYVVNLWEILFIFDFRYYFFRIVFNLRL